MPECPYNEYFLAGSFSDYVRILVPVVAHNERYQCLRKSEAIDETYSCGSSYADELQVSEGAESEYLERNCAEKQVLGGRIHLLATDMHRLD